MSSWSNARVSSSTAAHFVHQIDDHVDTFTPSTRMVASSSASYRSECFEVRARFVRASAMLTGALMPRVFSQ